MVRFALILCLLGTFPLLSIAQSFAQYQLAPTLLNPAWVGANSHLRLAVNHRRHRLSELDIQQTAASLSSPLHWGGRKRMGLGLHFLSDRADALGQLTTQEIGGAVAYHHPLAHQHYVSFGGQATYRQGRLGLEDVTTGSQWVTHRGFDPQQTINESLSNQRQRTHQLSAGALWYRERRPGQLAHYADVSAQSLNRSELRWLDGAERPAVRYTAQAGWQAFRRNKFSATPELLWQREAGLHYLNLGARFSYHFQNDNPFDPVGDGTVSLITRRTVGESAVVGVQLEQPHFVAGFAYDWGARSSREPGFQATEYGIVLRRTIFRPKPKPTPVITAPQQRTFTEPKPVPSESSETLPTAIPNSIPSNRTDAAPAVADSARLLTLKQPRAFTFGFNETTLNEGTERYLRDVVDLLQKNPHLHVRVVGHTDDVGSAEANRVVSQRRADAVRDFLLAQGVPPDRIQAIGRGSREPLLSGRDAAARTKNRRIEIELYTP